MLRRITRSDPVSTTLFFSIQKMKQYLLLLLCALTLTGCGIRVTSNGRKARFNPQKYRSDSTLVLNVSDSVPANATFISATKMHAPFLWEEGRDYDPYDLLLRYTALQKPNDLELMW